jgi:hypothetical protein
MPAWGGDRLGGALGEVRSADEEFADFADFADAALLQLRRTAFLVRK